MTKIESKLWKETFAERFKILDELRIEGQFCDIILRGSDGIEVNAHRNILCSASPYFRALFTSKMKERFANLIDLNHVKGDILQKIVEFIYHGEMEVNENEDIEEIGQSANYFQIDELTTECIKLLKSLINDDNCLRYWRFTQISLAESLEKMCIAHIFNSPAQLFNNDSFVNELTMEELKILLADDRMQCSEELNFIQTVKWAKSKTSEKIDFVSIFSELLPYIRLPLISKQFFLTHVLSDDDLIEHKSLLKKISECSKYVWIEPGPDACSSMDLVKPRLGTCKKGLIIISGIDVRSISNDGRSNTLMNKENNTRWFAQTTFNNFLLVCGGQKSCESCAKGKATNTCEYFLSTKKEWKQFPSMETPRWRHECAMHDNKIYACGGALSPTSVEVFDFGQEKWSVGPTLANGRYNFGLVSLDRALYAVGGSTSSNIEMYDERAGNEWTEVFNEWQNIWHTQCMAIGGTDIYCFHWGGNPCIFDTRMRRTRPWRREQFMIQNEFKVCKLNGNIYVLRESDEDKNYLNLSKYSMVGDLCSSYTFDFPKVGYPPEKGCSLVALYY